MQDLQEEKNLQGSLPRAAFIPKQSLMRQTNPGALRPAYEDVNHDCYKYSAALDWLVFLFFSPLSQRTRS